jgi:hypothetical protein
LAGVLATWIRNTISTITPAGRAEIILTPEKPYIRHRVGWFGCMKPFASRQSFLFVDSVGREVCMKQYSACLMQSDRFLIDQAYRGSRSSWIAKVYRLTATPDNSGNSPLSL